MALNKLIKEATWSLGGQFALVFLTASFQFLLARLYGATVVGILAVSLSSLSIATLLSTFGLHTAALKGVAYYLGQGDNERAYSTALLGGILTIVISTIAAVVFYLFSHFLIRLLFLEITISIVAKTLSVSIPLSALTLYIISVLQSAGNLRYRVIIEQIALPCLKIILLLVFAISIGRTALGVSYALITASVIGLILSLLFFIKADIFNSQNVFIQDISAWKMLVHALPLLLTDVSYRTLQESQILILGTLVEPQQLGIYFVCLRASSILGLFLTASNMIFAPKISLLHSHNNFQKIRELFTVATRWGVMLCIPFAIMAFVFAEKILILFGEDYTTGTTVFRILVISQFLNVATGGLGWLLIMTGQTYKNLVVSLFSILTNIVSILIFVPSYGILGAAVSSLLAIMVINGITLIIVSKTLNMQPFNSLYWKLTLCGSATALMMWFYINYVASSSILLQILSGLVIVFPIYILLTWIWALSETDKHVFNILIGRGSLASSK